MSVNKILVNNSDSNYTHSIFDISEYTGNSYSTLSDAINDIPQAKHKGGMTIRYVPTDDNKYVQYRYISSSNAAADFTNVANWQKQGAEVTTLENQSTGHTDIIIGTNKTEVASAEYADKLRVAVSDIKTMEPYEILTNKRIRTNDNTSEYDLSDTSVANISTMDVWKFNVEPGHTYGFSAYLDVTHTYWVVFWLDNNGNFIKRQLQGTRGVVDIWKNKLLVAPDDATEAWVNVVKSLKQYFNVINVKDSISSSELKDSIEQNSSDIEHIEENLTQIDKPTQTPFETLTGYRVAADDPNGTNPHIVPISSMTVKKYNVDDEKRYCFSAYETEGQSYYILFWFDSNGNHLRTDYQGTNGQIDMWTDEPVTPPSNASVLWMNIYNSFGDLFSFKEIVTELVDIPELKQQVEQNSSDIEHIEENLTQIDKPTQTPFETLTGYAVRADDPLGTNPQIVALSSMTVRKYNVEGGKDYCFSAKLPIGWSPYVLFWFDANGNHLRTDYAGHGKQVDIWTNEPVKSPTNASVLWMNIINSEIEHFSFKKIITELVDVPELKQQVEQNSSDIERLQVPKLMKVVINDLNGAVETTPFYIRSRYNESKDIIITHRVNSNGCVTFRATYIGPNTLTDEQLQQSSYLVSVHTDSTAPLFRPSQYWALFAQHGYVIPYINNPGLTNSDKGAEWKDQLDRHYNIGYVTNDRVWLLPVIYTQNGHYVRDWKAPSDTPITTLQHVSGGSYTTDITVSGLGSQQIFPVMEINNRIWIVDGRIVTESGTYYCNDFKVSETQIGYDPATVQTWFDSNGNVDLTGALPMIKFTYSFLYKGANCCVNTTMNILRPIDCYLYGGIQQQFFIDNGDYKAMFMIPKAKARNGVDFEKPFNSPSLSSQGYQFYRDATSLNNVDDIIDRQIGFLKNPNTNDYLVGMAAGLSLVSGDTVKVKRNRNCLTGNTNTHYLVLNFSPSNENKFYVAAFNTSPYANDDYYLPTGFFKEVNYYVSYFDPAENVGQVYWYKDGNGYVIYAHCQSVQNALAIKVPDFMEGLNLTVIEKTANTELLTDTIQNGKFFVNYNTTDANYIVLKAK